MIFPADSGGRGSAMRRGRDTGGGDHEVLFTESVSFPERTSPVSHNRRSHGYSIGKCDDERGRDWKEEFGRLTPGGEGVGLARYRDKFGSVRVGELLGLVWWFLIFIAPVGMDRVQSEKASF